MARDTAATQLILPRREFATFPLDDPLEERSLHFFQSRTAPQFAGHFEKEFWCRLVLQVGTREGCVRQAILALGELHVAFQEEHQGAVVGEGTWSGRGRAREKAAEYYAKAIRLLNAQIRERSWRGLDVSLLCCILCVAFEWLRGCYKAASTHLQSGLLILSQWSASRGLGAACGGGIAFSSPTGHLIRAQMAPVFTRLTLQARTFSTPWLGVGSLGGMESLVPPQRLQGEEYDLKAARDELDMLLSDVYLHPENFAPSYPQPVLSGAARAAFWNRLSQWHREYKHHLFHHPSFPTSEAPGRGGGPPPTPDKISLTMWYTTLTIMLATSHSADQMLYDAFLPQFSRMVAFADFLLSCSSFPVSPSPIPSSSAPTATALAATPSTRFALDMETVPMLYYVASKCRHPATRRKAITLLETAAPREGCWDGAASARLAKEIVGVEEEGLGLEQGADGTTLEEGMDERMVKAKMRVWKVSEETDLQGRRMRVRFLRQGQAEVGSLTVLTW